MISDSPHEAYVWIWLPGETEPVVAGRLQQEGGTLSFTYGRSYLNRRDSPVAIPIYEPELPLKRGLQWPLPGLSMPGSIRDASPDAWGRRVILNRLSSSSARAGITDRSELTFMLESGSDRIGALDFQRSASHYQPRESQQATLEALLESARRIDQGIPLSPELDAALLHGSSIGGARPKALIESDGKKHIAKFSSSSDLYNVVKAEFIAMRLARIAGLHAASVDLTRAAGRDILLIERFDREPVTGGWARKSMVSALTLLELDEMMARYASYEDLADLIRHRFTQPGETLRELFSRMVFNVLTGNTDDHARNHAAFWDGHQLALTPAYDICPQGRSGNEASQAMLIAGNNNLSQLSTCLAAAHNFLLSPAEARDICNHLIHCIKGHWKDVCEEAELPDTEADALLGRQFLNPFSMVMD